MGEHGVDLRGYAENFLFKRAHKFMGIAQGHCFVEFNVLLNAQAAVDATAR